VVNRNAKNADIFHNASECSVFLVYYGTGY